VVLVSRDSDVDKRVTVLRVQLSVVLVWSCKLKVDFTVICKDGYCDICTGMPGSDRNKFTFSFV
jgi:hypothetical protein